MQQNQIQKQESSEEDAKASWGESRM
jgi:hypothetical protein